MNRLTAPRAAARFMASTLTGCAGFFFGKLSAMSLNVPVLADCLEESRKART
ncbi:MAG: hypothetical protein NTY98_30390 [Verrucomicrobia bacterium]|nr:hypothetical protein [Verrucomicrobiota bacterium]